MSEFHLTNAAYELRELAKSFRRAAIASAKEDPADCEESNAFELRAARAIRSAAAVEELLLSS